MNKEKYSLLILVILVTVSIGCKNKQNNLIYNINDLPKKHIIDMVRIPQNDNYSCATTSVAMIITYYQELVKPLDKEFVWEISKTDKERILKYGNDISGLNRICDYYNYKHEFKQNISYDDLRYYISKNIPVIIFISFDQTHNHATVLNGYDTDKKLFYVIDPSIDDKEMPEQFLEKHWWAVLSNPKTESYRAGYIINNTKNNQ